MRRITPTAVQNKYLLVLLAVFFFYTTNAESQSVPLQLIERYEEVFLSVDSANQELPVRLLLEEAESYRDNNPDDAEAWIACGLIRGGYALTQSFRILGILKTVRQELETAIELNPEAIDGYAQAFLGRLYMRLPAWPISYGSEKKAQRMFDEALAINSQTKAANLYYGLLLTERKDLQQALQYLERAKAASPRPGLPNWDAVLDRDIERAFSAL